MLGLYQVMQRVIWSGGGNNTLCGEKYQYSDPLCLDEFHMAVHGVHCDEPHAGHFSGRNSKDGTVKYQETILEQLCSFVTQLRSLKSPYDTSICLVLGGSVYDHHLRIDVP